MNRNRLVTPCTEGIGCVITFLCACRDDGIRLVHFDCVRGVTGVAGEVLARCVEEKTALTRRQGTGGTISVVDSRSARIVLPVPRHGGVADVPSRAIGKGRYNWKRLGRDGVRKADNRRAG